MDYESEGEDYDEEHDKTSTTAKQRQPDPDSEEDDEDAVRSVNYFNLCTDAVVLAVLERAGEETGSSSGKVARSRRGGFGLRSKLAFARIPSARYAANQKTQA